LGSSDAVYSLLTFFLRKEVRDRQVALSAVVIERQDPRPFAQFRQLLVNRCKAATRAKALNNPYNAAGGAPLYRAAMATAAVKGYPIILVLPDSMSIERRRLMLAFGARGRHADRAFGGRQPCGV
jgi:hypothetical protein